MAKKGRLLRGAAAIAERVFGDKAKNRSVYALVRELPVLRLGGTLAAWEGHIDEAMEAKEQQGLARCRVKTRRQAAQKRPAAPRAAGDNSADADRTAATAAHTEPGEPDASPS